jgi:hypothetical protein
VDAVVPIPSTSIYPLIPDVSAFTYTPPSIVIEKPAEKPSPSMGTIPTPIGYFSGINEITTRINLTNDVDMYRQQSKNLSIGLKYDYGADTFMQQSKNLSIGLIYEVVLST